MNLNIFYNNFMGLSNFEMNCVEYLSGKAFSDWADCNEDLYNDIVEAFKPYVGVTNCHNELHPFWLIFDKLTKNVTTTPLIVQTNLYGEEYEKLAKRVNNLYMNGYQTEIDIVLEALKKRDMDELTDKFCVNESEVNMEMVVTNLDENDFKTILNFCHA